MELMLLQLDLARQNQMLLLKKVLKLKGLSIRVIGSSFIISSAISIKIKNVFSLSKLASEF